jgi:hypothetical protein
LGVSFWTSVSLLGDAVFIQMWNVPPSSRLPAIKGAIAALAGYEQIALAIVAAVGVAIWVALFAVLGALRTRYSRRVNIAASSLLLLGFALALLALAELNGNVSPSVGDAIFAAVRWIAGAATILAITYVFWSGFAERVLTMRYACGVFVLSSVFGAAWLMMLHAAGFQFAGMPATNFHAVLWPVLLVPLVSVLAPWSLNRIRHI